MKSKNDDSKVLLYFILVCILLAVLLFIVASLNKRNRNEDKISENISEIYINGRHGICSFTDNDVLVCNFKDSGK